MPSCLCSEGSKPANWPRTCHQGEDTRCNEASIAAAVPDQALSERCHLLPRALPSHERVVYTQACENKRFPMVTSAQIPFAHNWLTL